MKKSILARGFIGSVASLLGVVAVGCSADSGWEGAAGEGEIGSVEQAVTVALPSSAVRTQWQSCRLKVASTELLLSVAGLDNLITPNVDGTIFLQDATNNQNLTPVGTTSVAARSHYEMINDPASPSDSCILIGGQDDAATPAAISGANDKAYRIVVSKPGASFSIAVNAITGLTPRSKLRVDTCGNNSIIAVGGDDGGTADNIIEVLTSGSSAFASVTGGTLAVARRDFGLAKSAHIPAAPASQQAGRFFVVTGGINQNSGSLASAEALEFNDDCTSVTKQTLTVSGGSALSAARGQMVAFESSYSNGVSTIEVPGGFTTSGSVTRRDLDTLTVTWSSLPAITRANAATALPSGGVKGMKLVKDTANNVFYFVGGTDNSNAALPFVFKSTAAATLAQHAAANDFVTAREGMGVAYMADLAKIQIAGGNDGTTVYGSTEEITP